MSESNEIPKPQPTIAELQAQLDALRAEMAQELATQKAAAEEDLRQAKIQTASESLKTRKDSGLTSTQMEIRRDAAIKEVGGNAPFHKLPVEQRLEMQGISGSSQITDKALREVFGAKSDSRKASELMQESPSKYRRMRIIARERGIL